MCCSRYLWVLWCCDNCDVCSCSPYLTAYAVCLFEWCWCPCVFLDYSFVFVYCVIAAICVVSPYGFALSFLLYFILVVCLCVFCMLLMFVVFINIYFQLISW